jgi:hypothetical protein
VLRAEAEFRETVTHMAGVLQGENLIEARELLREIIGTVRLDPDTDSPYREVSSARRFRY